MAAPHFNSQHSEVMLDVSAFHSSAQSTPQTKHHQAAKVAKSPTIEASQSHRVAKSVERVEDSYQESLPMQPPPQHAGTDKDDDLYSLSPKGRQSLDATVAKRKAQAKRKQASAPKAKTIGALLDAGATVPSSAMNVATSDTKSMEKPHTSTRARHRVDVNAESGHASVDKTTAADQHVRGKDHEPDGTNPETHRPRHENSKKVDNEAIADMSKDKTESHGLHAQARNVTTKASTGKDKPSRTADAIKTKTHEAHLSNGEKTSEKNHGGRGVDTGNTGLPALSTRTILPAQSQDSRQAKASANQSKGRPQRQAKQTALGKLKEKHSRTESDADSMTDDSQDDGFDIAAQSRQTKKVTDRKQKAKHLPTPVTEGNLAKKQAETKSNGKLKSAKQQQTNAAAGAKKQPNKTSTLGKAAPSEPTGRSGRPVAQEDVVHLSTESRLSQSPPGHQSTNTITTSPKQQHEAEDTPPPRRPGALKRPGRPRPRGRRPQTDTPYDFPGTSSNTRKKRRSISRASKASTARAGPARQRMQSESVKERREHVNNGSQLPSASRLTSPRTGEPKGRLRKPSVSRRKDADSRQPPRTQAKDTATQRESHVSQPVRSSYAANLESREPATGSKQARTREKPGSSQVHAIMIEQDSRSESSTTPSPRKPATTLPQARGRITSRHSHIERAQTPAMMPSSPPGSGRGYVFPTAREKPTIIAFGRQGPRNQGVSSAKKAPASVPSSKLSSESRTTKAGTPGDHAGTIGLATQLFPPSSQPSYKPSTQVTHTAQPRNVAKGEDSVFDEFTKNGQNKALAHMLQNPSTKASELVQEDQDGRFAVIDDFEGTTLVEDCEQAESSIKQPTASQVAMPPPNVVTRGKKNSKAASATVHLPTKTAAEAAATKDTPRPAPAKKVMNVPKVKESAKPIPGDGSLKLLAKGGAQRFEPGRAMVADKTAKSKSLMGQTMAQQSQKTRKRGSAEPQPGSTSKRIRLSQETMLEAPEGRLSHVRKAPGSLGVPVEDLTDRLDRRKGRPSRRSTQASQGVDILGSPYPKDLEVPKQTTALEVFSQQAGLSSDQTERSDAAQPSRLDLQAISGMVPTTKVGLPVPAAPRGRSKAVTRIASGTLAEQLLVLRSVRSSEENPFTSSRERGSSAGEQPAANKFRDALRQRGVDLSDRPPAVRSEELGNGSFDDAERTLVEPVDDLEKANKDIENSPGASKASHANSPDGAAKVLEDVGDWRNSLKPHQSHLFDSLVIAAHKLVRHVVDNEAADRTMIADYRRRGEIIVNELQRAHAKDYQQYTQDVQGWKVQAADELAAHGRKLKQRMRDAEKARAERKKGLIARNRFDDVLEELVAGLD
ncbi:hypothetical protein Q7P35_011768 [Cladosporium inversicolor]